LLTGKNKSLPWVENGFDLTVDGSILKKRMLLALFADHNLSPLRLALFFTMIPLSFIDLRGPGQTPYFK